ncbi:hypothetical protein RRG08_005047 [Elysia crispata]|uniref:Uncharacterized protein n=1 Tax=Elysia crispata TaxID=231223 RepID=A0AAE1CPP6_9GAST|nr:hypothetical protein RRG08_005047 [Elysia crispata]
MRIKLLSYNMWTLITYGNTSCCVHGYVAFFPWRWVPMSTSFLITLLKTTNTVECLVKINQIKASNHLLGSHWFSRVFIR